MSIRENYFKGTFVNSSGKRVDKEFKSTKQSSTELQRDAIKSMKDKGYSYKSGSMGSRNK